ncbi:MAG: hypothetical protein U0234_33105 [Sandaracinus sp.]
MHARRSALIGLVLLAGASGCVRRYPQPSPEEPHADVQIRVVHHQELAPRYDESVQIDGYAVSFGEAVPGVRQTTMRVRPGPADWAFSTDFFHEVTTWQTQTYWQSQSYVCGSGRYGPQYCSRSIPMTRTVPVTVRVPDGGCTTGMMQTPLAGAVYLVQYELVANGICQATCQRLLAGPGGTTVAMPCGAGEPIPQTVVPPAAYVDAPMTSAPYASEFPEEATSGGEIVPAPSTAASGLAAPR